MKKYLRVAAILFITSFNIGLGIGNYITHTMIEEKYEYIHFLEKHVDPLLIEMYKKGYICE